MHPKPHLNCNLNCKIRRFYINKSCSQIPARCCSFSASLQACRTLSSMSHFMLLGQPESHLVHLIFCDCTLARGILRLDKHCSPCLDLFPLLLRGSCWSGWAVKESCEQLPKNLLLLIQTLRLPPRATGACISFIRQHFKNNVTIKELPLSFSFHQHCHIYIYKRFKRLKQKAISFSYSFSWANLIKSLPSINCSP